MTAPGFLLDLDRCVGCGACVLACRLENDVPQGISWRRIVSLNLPRMRGGPTYHLTLACHHCRNPPCEAACPSGALEKGPEGIVRLHGDRCLGCRYCEMACPFGAPTFDADRGVMTKCHLCVHRLEKDLLPACVAACPTAALRFSMDVERGGGTFVAADTVPGFVDPAGARPGLRIGLPGGGIRTARFAELEEALSPGGDGGREGES